MGGLAREIAAGLLAGIGDLLGIADPARAIARFDGMSDADVAERAQLAAADPLISSAVAALGKDDGQRTV